MDRKELEAVRKNNAAIVQDICAQYGLYGNVVYYEPSPMANSSMNRMYIVAGLDPDFAKEPFPKKYRPDEMLSALQRNEKLFYPQIWVLDLKENGDELFATEALVEYCKKASFLAQLYGEYGLSAPEVLRVSEVYQLINFRDGLDNPRATQRMLEKYRKDLDWFMKREKSQNMFRQVWLEYFRSDKYPDDQGPIGKVIGLFRKEKSEVALNQLMECNTNVSKLELQEFEFRIFQKLIQERYPFVTYAAADKDIVDHGISKATRRDDSPFGKHVTAEEYAVIRKERFAEEGWDCLANLKPAYWEFRDIYFKDCDEPLIASVYQHITLQYAKCDSLGDLKKLGPMKLQKIPASDFMNFVSLAKANKLRFYIDTLGEYERPALGTVNVLYSECQQQKMDKVVSRMIDDKVNYSHVLAPYGHPSLTMQINKSKEKYQISSSRSDHRQSPYEK